MIVTEAHNEARRILMENRDVLETITRRLLEKEVMEGDELRAILDEAHKRDATTIATDAPETQSTK